MGGGALELPLPCFHSSPLSASASPPLPATGGLLSLPGFWGASPFPLGLLLPPLSLPSLAACVCVCVCISLL